ncbi:MAG: hypothetical protein ACRC2J_06410 [Microcoleaceae cyanobacterium]
MNLTILLTLALLSMMCGLGAFTGAWGFKMGREALKGITQPDTRPNNALIGAKTSTRREEIVFLKEKNILANVKKSMTTAGGGNTNSQQPPKTGEKAKTEEAKKPVARFPIIASDSGVKLEISDVRKWGNSLILDVNLKNDGQKAVRFLYSFLNVTDDQGRALSASTEDLPGELPPNGRSYYGIVTIPVALLADAKELSLTLTDYPDQKLQLKMPKIPLTQ